MNLQLPADKMSELRISLDSFAKRKRASRRQLQYLAGKLNWACQVIRGGRIFVRRILDIVNNLQKPSHKLKLTADFQLDIQWRIDFM